MLLNLKDFDRRRRNFQKSYQQNLIAFFAVKFCVALSFRKFDNSFIVVKFPLKNSMLITFRFENCLALMLIFSPKYCKFECNIKCFLQYVVSAEAPKCLYVVIISTLSRRSFHFKKINPFVNSPLRLRSAPNLTTGFLK